MRPRQGRSARPSPIASDGSPSLPHWPPGTVAILSTSGDGAHAIPVSTAVRAGNARVLLALARRRESLARLRADPRVGLTLLCRGAVAVTAHCRARVLCEAMAVSEAVAAIELEVVAIQDHAQPTFEINDGVRWRWTDREAQRRDDEIRAELAALAGGAG